MPMVLRKGVWAYGRMGENPTYAHTPHADTPLPSFAICYPPPYRLDLFHQAIYYCST